MRAHDDITFNPYASVIKTLHAVLHPCSLFVSMST